MSEEDKKIEIQLADAKIETNNAKIGGYALTVGRKIIGEIAGLNGKSATVEGEEVEAFFKALEQTTESTIENYNLNR